ncbi:MAG: S41 family peptidase [Firmicutes bacterium]|nr:S41 family peptidase [Bacillota bacterium]
MRVINTSKLLTLILVLIAAVFFLLAAPGALYAQNNGNGGNGDSGDKKPAPLESSDIEAIVNLMIKEYYDPLDAKTLTEGFVKGVDDYTKRKKIENPVAGLTASENLKQFSGIFADKIKAKGISQKDMQAYMYAGIRGMLKTFNNNECRFYRPGRYRQTLQESGYTEGGCGFFVDEKNKDTQSRWMVIETLQDLPADKQGIQSGDRLIAVNGKSVKELEFRQLTKEVRGPVGSKVILTIYRPALNKEIKVTVVRTFLGPNPKSLRYKILPGNIGYIKFRYLGERMNTSLEEIQDEFARKKVKKVIWDMRNSAGTMTGALDLAAGFAKENEVFAERLFKTGSESFKGTGDKDALKIKPDAVIMNRYTSASCAFVALVLDKYHKIPIIGQKMIWDGDDTKSYHLRDDSYFTMPYAYYKFNGGKLLKNGVVIEPTIAVEQIPLPPYQGGDKQLNKAAGN